MKYPRWSTLLLALCCSALLVIGCNLDADDPTEDDQETADRLVSEANTALENILFEQINSDNPEDPSNVDLSSIYELYTDAIEADENHAGANFGAGILEITMLAQDDQFDALFDRLQEMAMWDGYFLVEDGGSGAMQFNGPVFALSNIRLPLGAPIGIAKNLTNLEDFDPVEFSEIQGVIEQSVLPRLDRAIGHLNVVTQNSSFTFIVSPRMQGDDREDAVELDLTEVYASLTLLNSIRALMHQTIAYDFDLGDYTGQDLIDAVSPGSPFMALRANGQASMASALASWRGALDALQAGISFLENETDPQHDDLIRLDPFDMNAVEDFNRLKSELPKVHDLLYTSHIFMVDLNDDGIKNEELEVSLKAYFENPIVDLKTLLPGYSAELGMGGYEDYRYESGTVSATVTVDTEEYYMWYRDGYFNYGEPEDQNENYNINIPEFESWFQARIDESSNLGWTYISLAWGETLSAGTHDIEAHYFYEYPIEFTHYKVDMTWDANSFDEWILPNPTLNGLFPGMSDETIKLIFDMDESNWSKTFSIF